MRHILAGRKGEKTAARYLKRNGYHVVELNYRSKFGEIDIKGRRDALYRGKGTKLRQIRHGV
jgi:Holliday junction resolvase-like predicted endonuclease